MSIKIGTLKDESNPETDEARIVKASDGTIYRIVMAKKYWASFDYLSNKDTNVDGWQSNDVVDMLSEYAKELDRPLEDYFPDGVVYMHNRLNQARRERLEKEQIKN